MGIARRGIHPDSLEVLEEGQGGNRPSKSGYVAFHGSLESSSANHSPILPHYNDLRYNTSMKVISLQSGSNGNCIYVEANGASCSSTPESVPVMSKSGSPSMAGI